MIFKISVLQHAGSMIPASFGAGVANCGASFMALAQFLEPTSSEGSSEAIIVIPVVYW
jgi:hypothetical protein